MALTEFDPQNCADLHALPKTLPEIPARNWPGPIRLGMTARQWCSAPRLAVRSTKPGVCRSPHEWKMHVKNISESSEALNRPNVLKCPIFRFSKFGLSVTQTHRPHRPPHTLSGVLRRLEPLRNGSPKRSTRCDIGRERTRKVERADDEGGSSRFQALTISTLDQNSITYITYLIAPKQEHPSLQKTSENNGHSSSAIPTARRESPDGSPLAPSPVPPSVPPSRLPVRRVRQGFPSSVPPSVPSEGGNPTLVRKAIYFEERFWDEAPPNNLSREAKRAGTRTDPHRLRAEHVGRSSGCVPISAEKGRLRNGHKSWGVPSS